VFMSVGAERGAIDGARQDAQVVSAPAACEIVLWRVCISNWEFERPIKDLATLRGARSLT
jgi:hypothetical protein